MFMRCAKAGDSTADKVVKNKILNKILTQTIPKISNKMVKIKTEQTILLLQSMSHNISNPVNYVDITEDIKTIVYWSNDSWDWENQLAKDIIEIIELYEKTCTFASKNIFKESNHAKQK